MHWRFGWEGSRAIVVDLDEALYRQPDASTPPHSASIPAFCAFQRKITIFNVHTFFEKSAVSYTNKSVAFFHCHFCFRCWHCDAQAGWVSFILFICRYQLLVPWDALPSTNVPKISLLQIPGFSAWTNGVYPPKNHEAINIFHTRRGWGINPIL